MPSVTPPVIGQPSAPGVRLIDVAGNGSVVPNFPLSAYSVMSIPAYRRAVTFLCENLASFPKRVEKEGAKDGALDHPLNKMLKRRPNQLQNPFIFWRTLFYHATGPAANGYARIERDGVTSAPIAIHNWMPDRVVPFRFDAADGQGMQQYYYSRDENRIYYAADVIHLQGLGYDGQIGTDQVCQHAETFTHAATLTTYQVQYLSKGTVLRGAIEVPGSMDDPQIQQMRGVLRKFRGAEGEDDILILTDSAKLNNATTNPDDSQLVEQVSGSTKAVAQITGVPPEFLFEQSEAKYNNNVEQAGQNVVRYCFRPWIEQAEDELTFKLLTPAEQDAGYSICINADALLRGDTKTQTDVVTAQVDGGIRTPNEGRSLLNLPPSTDPEANKLKRSGDTSPPSPATAPPERVANAAERSPDVFTALGPVIAAACSRVEGKADNAFTNSNKTGQELTLWANVFAEGQKRYAIEALSSVRESFAALTGKADPFDVDLIGERYAQAIRQRAGGVAYSPLADIVAKAIASPAA